MAMKLPLITDDGHVSEVSGLEGIIYTVIIYTVNIYSYNKV